MRSIVVHLRGEHGQILILSALLLTTILGLTGLVVDVGRFYAERRQAQNAADEASVAAAYELSYGGSIADATATALANAAANGFDNNGTSNTVTVNIPPTTGENIGDPNYAEVVVVENPITFFAHAVVPSIGDVQGRGVAGFTPTFGSLFFATDTNCGIQRTIHIGGTNNVFDGDMHTNGGVLHIGDDNHTITGAATYVCSADDVDPPSSVGSGPTQVAAVPPPFTYTYSDFTTAGCLFTVAGNMLISSATPQYWLNDDPATKVLKSGIFCATGDIKLVATGVTGTVTFASQGGKVELDAAGSGFNLTPYWNNILLFSEGTDPEEAIEIGGSNSQWTGILHAPLGGVKIGGPGHVSTETQVVAFRIKAEPDGIQLTAGSFGNNGGVRLYE